jgi:hypothetical protein
MTKRALRARACFGSFRCEANRVSVNDAAGTRNIRQEKPGQSATLRHSPVIAGLPLLCTVQRQICTCFHQ